MELILKLPEHNLHHIQTHLKLPELNKTQFN